MADPEQPTATAVSSPSANIDISTRAVVAWGSSDFLSDVTFDARRLESTNDAFFKLRSTVRLKAFAPTKTPLFVFIHPERIQSLQIEDPKAEEANQAAHAGTARKELGTDAVCLRFVLTKPGDLVGPKTSDLTPKNKASGVVLDSLRSLAHQEHFAVYIPQHVLSRTRLAILCEDATHGVLNSIVRQADLASLYRGKGGQCLNQPDEFDDASTASLNSPPSYDELESGPPAAPLAVPSAGPSKKRRRRSSSNSACDTIDPLDIERRCRKVVEEQKAVMLKVIEEQQTKLYERLLADLKPYIGSEMLKLENRILDHVEQRSGKLAEEQDDNLEQRLEEVQNEVNDTIETRVSEVDEKVEGEFYGLKLSLEEYIQGELAEAEERIVENLQSSASVSIQFT